MSSKAAAANVRSHLDELAAALETDRTLRLGSPPPSSEQLTYSTALIRQQRRAAAGRVAPVRSLDPDGATLCSTMLGTVDRDDALPLHEQVAAEIRRAIADGEAGPGDRLPPARDLAAVLGVNSNTVLRALRMLRDEGLLEFRRGRGVDRRRHARARRGPRARA
jgi:GntR family transcriptional regulator